MDNTIPDSSGIQKPVDSAATVDAPSSGDAASDASHQLGTDASLTGLSERELTMIRAVLNSERSTALHYAGLDTRVLTNTDEI